MFYPRGEEIAAREAGIAGTIYVLSTLSGCRLEDVRAATEGPAWYQLYLVGGHDAARAGIARARQAGFSALVVTVDTPVAGLRERDIRNGTRELLIGGLSALPSWGSSSPGRDWLIGFLRDGGLMNFPNVVPPGQGPLPYLDVAAALEQTTVTWKDFAWIRESLGRPDTRQRRAHWRRRPPRPRRRRRGIIVSNHGARQLDGVSATLRALPEVIEAVTAAPKSWSTAASAGAATCQGVVSGCPRGARRPGVRLRARRGGWTGRRARHRDTPDGYDPYAEAARVCFDPRPRSVVHRRAVRLDALRAAPGQRLDATRLGVTTRPRTVSGARPGRAL